MEHRGSVVLLVLVLAVPMMPAQAPGTPVSQAQTVLDPDLADAGPGPVEVIVSFDAPTPETLERVEEHGTILYRYSVVDGAHVRVDASDLEDLARIDRVWRIDAVEEVSLWLDVSRPTIRVGPPLWDRGLQGANATVAVVDTGIDGRHPGLEGRVRTEIEFPAGGAPPYESQPTDVDGHGTHVAGIVGGTGAGSSTLGSDSGNYIGVAKRTRYVSLDVSAEFNTANTLRAFDWVHNNHERVGIEVVQNSWGRSDVSQPYDPQDPMIRASNRLVVEDKLVVVFAAANQGPEPSTLSMEAENPNVLTVAATDDTGKVAEFSSRGPVLLEGGQQADWLKPDIAAPGVRISSAESTQTVDGISADAPYKKLSGTSMAAPHVAGIAAMIRGVAPDMHPFDVYESITATARDLGPQGPDFATGHGMVVADRAIQLALSGGGQLPDAERWTEHYRRNGTLGAPTVLGDLTGDAGAPRTANGTFPVKPFATRVRFHFNWTPQGEPAPDVDVELIRPGGSRADLTVEGQSAQATIDQPRTGFWEWRAESTGTSVSSADYTMVSHVDMEPASSRDFAPRGPSGGFLDGYIEEIESFARYAWNFHREKVVAAGALVGVIVVVKLIW